MPLGLLGAIPWRLIAAVGIAAGLFFGAMYVVGTIKQLGATQALLKSSISIGNANAELAKSQAATSKRIDAVATLAAIRKAEIRAKSDERRKAIIHAPPETDAPLAPILRDQLDRLPERPAGADAGDRAPAPGDSGSAPAADVRASPAGSARNPARRRVGDRRFHRSARVMQCGQGRYCRHLGGVRAWKPSTA